VPKRCISRYFYVLGVSKNMISKHSSLRGGARRYGRRGQTLVEYALILAFIAVVAIGVLMALGGSVKTTFANTNVQLSTAQLGGVAAQRGGG